MQLRHVAAAVCVGFLAVVSGVPAAALPPSQGHAFIDVRDRSAVFWVRAGGPGTVDLQLRGPDGSVRNVVVEVDPENDLVASTRIRGLTPDTRYSIDVRVPGAKGTPDRHSRGRLRTAPASTMASAVRLAFGGDVGGQNVCRDATHGYAVFSAVKARVPDVFVGLGDMIYADDACRAEGRYGNAQIAGPTLPAKTLAGFRERWRYNRNDLNWINLMRVASYVPVWDDHEVVNDFGPGHDAHAEDPATHLLPAGRQAFLEYNPIVTREGEPLYRRLRWGEHLELFILDTRSHRDANASPDSAARPKSMLGRGQRDWLIDSLTISDATWAVVVSSVPISIPTGGFPDAASGRDGWADYDQETGFERELRLILADLGRSHPHNMVWITTDVHFAAVHAYRPLPGRPGFVFHEVVTGPISAGIFPSDDLDPSFHPTRLFRWPAARDAGGEIAIESFDQAMDVFNFGELDVAADGTLTVRVVNGRGRVVYEQRLEAPAHVGASASSGSTGE